MSDRCKFDMSWVGQCKAPAVAGADYCVKHSPMRCVSCGAKATRDCEHTMQFVCGSPLCEGCEHGPNYSTVSHQPKPPQNPAPKTSPMTDPANAPAPTTDEARRIEEIQAAAYRCVMGLGTPTLQDIVDLLMDAHERWEASHVAQLAAARDDNVRLRDAAIWLGSNAPGTPVPEWIDAALARDGGGAT